MDIQHIPKTFWHALSVAVLVVSFGVIYIAYRSSSVSIELANAKISLSSEVASSTIALKNALEMTKKAKEEAEKEYSVLVRKNDLINMRFKFLEEEAKINQNLLDALNNFELECKDCINSKPLPNLLDTSEFELSLEEVQKSLYNLEAINREIQPIK